MHTFIARDPDACAVFISQSVGSAGNGNGFKLARLLLISLFLCYEGKSIGGEKVSGGNCVLRSNDSSGNSNNSSGNSKTSGNNKTSGAERTESKKLTKKGRGRKRNAEETTEAETTSEQTNDGFGTTTISKEDIEFQSSLLHIITVLLQRLRRISSAEDLEEGSVYLLNEITVSQVFVYYIE